MSIIAIIPVKGDDPYYDEKIGEKTLLQRAIESAKEASLIERVIVSTDSQTIAEKAKKYGAEVPWLREKELSAKGVPVERVLQDVALKLKEAKIIVTLEIRHPFRPKGLLDQMINVLKNDGLDTVFTAIEEKDSFWTESAAGLKRLDETSRRAERKPLYREMLGIGAASLSEVIAKGEHIGARIGVIPVRGLPSRIEVNSQEDLWLARQVFEGILEK